ncbi:MAG: FAD-dependent oxidoreductase [Actinomycetota bacterium]
MGQPSETIDADVCILGGGPHGLAAAVHLRRAEPSLRLAVIDPAGDWMVGWHQQFARADIAILRSPIVHHPASDPDELSAFVMRTGAATSGMRYHLPVTGTFAAFCADLVQEADLDRPVAASATAVHPDGNGLRVTTTENAVRADHLVVATNPHQRSIPGWVWPLLGTCPGLVVYGGDVDLRSLPDLTGERVVVIGGGLTAAHLACGAADRGAQVHLIARRPLVSRSFDTDPGWLGPKHLRAFWRDDDPESRLHTARAARGGGSVPPWMMERIAEARTAGHLHLHEGCEVRAAGIDPEGSGTLALDDHAGIRADRIWLATGSVPDVGAARCLSRLTPDVPVLDGFPITDDQLRLGPHPVFVMGRLAMLALGPAAGNLWGAQRAASRITDAITGVRIGREVSGAPRPPNRAAPHRPPGHERA